MERTESAGGVILNDEGDIVLVKNGIHFWGFPKGHIDPGEDALTAAKREIQEETGVIDLDRIGEFPPYERYRGNPDGGEDTSELKTIHMFLFHTKATELLPEDPHNPEARWFTIDDAVNALTHVKDKEFLLTHTEMIRKAIAR